MKTSIKFGAILAAVALFMALAATALLLAPLPAWAAAAAGGATSGSEAWSWGLAAAAVSTGLSSLAAGYAVGSLFLKGQAARRRASRAACCA